MTLTGILSIDKPQGWTSHDVVARVRRLSGQRQVGHAGTLDPLATGVLLLVLGRATKLSSYLMNSTKTYRADIVLGVSTVTDDAEAPIATRRDASGVSMSDVEYCLPSLLGNIAQIPPAYAAIRQDGKKMYELARKGIEVRAVPRQVTIHSIEIEAWKPPRIRLRIRCEAGTYIRSIARDLGEMLAVGGYLHALRREASGEFLASDAHSLDALGDVVEAQGVEGLARLLEPPDRAVLDWPAIVVGDRDERGLRHGQPISLPQPHTGNLRVYSVNGRFLALASGAGRVTKPFLNMNTDTSCA